MSVPAAQLSCQQCQGRKTKCSKTVPCLACQKAGITCTAVQRHRLPRGRSGRAKAALSNGQTLKDKISRLETIVSQLQQKDSSKQSSVNGTGTGIQDSSTSTLNTVESFIATAFWTELSDAVTGLKDILENPDTSEEADNFDDSYAALSISKGIPNLDKALVANPSTILFRSSSLLPRNQFNPPIELKDWLLTVYKDRVDAIFKPLHWPTTLTTILSSRQDIASSTDTKVLETAVYFTATCSLLDHELEDRMILVEQFQQAAELLFVQTSLLTTTSQVILQAFVIYLAGLRACQANAQQWTLVATAIRIANAQGIPTRISNPQSSFNTEILRRLWFCIGVLDLQSAFDRGSQPLLKSSDLQPWPLDVDDADISLQSMPSPRLVQNIRYTGMSLSMIIYQAGVCQRRLTEIGLSASLRDNITDVIAANYEQIGILADFERHIKLVTELCKVSSSPIQSFTVAVANESLVAMRLLIHRPLYRRRKDSVPNVIGPTFKFDLLGTATEILERSQMKRNQPEFAQWAWFSWVKWYALAVVLAELCTAQGPQADHAWEISKRSYSDYAKAVADTKTGLLWKPIVKLMRHVISAREALLVSEKTASQMSSHAQDMLIPPDIDAMEALFPSLEMQHLSTYASLVHDQSNIIAPQEDLESGMLTENDNDMSWIYWDLLIDDLNNNNSFDRQVSTQLNQDLFYG